MAKKKSEPVWGVWPDGEEQHAFVEDDDGLAAPLCGVVVAVDEVDTEPIANRCPDCVQALRLEGIES